MMNLTISHLQQLYSTGQMSPRRLLTSLLDSCRRADPSIWIRLLREEELQPYLARLESAHPEELPLYGIPFVVKDNIDLAGIPTSAACPEYSYTPDRSAFVVEMLIRAGAVPLGKTNLDQFATGLVGTRSPHGACKNSFQPDFISGGSSSGSAVAVAKGLCTFSLGTDTAGSGRVPAAFNNILGVKPTRGLLSTRGVVPACRSLDCVSIFALCAADADRVVRVARQYDKEDPWSRPGVPAPPAAGTGESFTFGVPARDQLAFFGNHEYEQCFKTSVDLLTSLGGTAVEIDFSPFLAAARLLYEGPWVQERQVAVGAFLGANPAAGDPVVRRIICDSPSASASDFFRALYRLKELKRETDTIMAGVDVLVTPTAGTCYTIAEVMAEPIALNSNLGYYTNFMNLLDYCALAVPTALTATVPFGVTLVGQALHDDRLLALGARLHSAAQVGMGISKEPPPVFTARHNRQEVLLAVCGAHMRGLPLHHQLMELGAEFIQKTKTAPAYRMYALNSEPPKPGLIRDEEMGQQQQVEVYRLAMAAFGHLVVGIPAPLGIGKLELEDGRWIPGFLAEPLIQRTSREITAFQGWRPYLETTGEGDR